MKNSESSELYRSFFISSCSDALPTRVSVSCGACTSVSLVSEGDMVSGSNLGIVSLLSLSSHFFSSFCFVPFQTFFSCFSSPSSCLLMSLSSSSGSDNSGCIGNR